QARGDPAVNRKRSFTLRRGIREAQGGRSSRPGGEYAVVGALRTAAGNLSLAGAAARGASAGLGRASIGRRMVLLYWCGCTWNRNAHLRRVRAVEGVAEKIRLHSREGRRSRQGSHRQERQDLR